MQSACSAELSFCYGSKRLSSSAQLGLSFYPHWLWKPLHST